MKGILFLLYAFLISIGALAQGEVPVNMYTGSPGIFVNLYTLTDHDLSETLTMSYNVNGVNLNTGSIYGVGWNLSVGGQISRKVRGLPDDFVGTGSDTRRGWLYNSNHSNLLQFPNSSDLSAGTPCSDEQSDQTWITNLQYNMDSEPDIFSFSVGSYSGKFVFDNAKTIQLIPYQDILIAPTYAADQSISGWTITTNTGKIYTLNETCTRTRSITKTANQTYLSVLNRDYNLYDTLVSFTSDWMLSQCLSPSGASITYTYKLPANGTATISNAWKVQIFNPTGTVAKDIFPLMTDRGTSTTKIVSTITTSSGLSATCDPIGGIQITDVKRSLNYFKSFALAYSDGMLTSITESDGNSCIQLPPYKFYYSAWVGNGSGSSSQDFWGFYNGAYNANSYGVPTGFPTIYVYPNEPANERYRLYRIPSYTGTEIILYGDANRLPDPNAIISGTLSRLVYPTGGETDFVFESNQFYDSRTGQNQYGGGLRIQRITYFDDLTTAAITKTFSYLDQGHSSGKLINKPSFVIPLWQQKVPTYGVYTQHATTYGQLSGNAVWQDLIAVTAIDISSQDNTYGSSIGYTHATVTRPGQGYVDFDYYAPAVYGDATAGIGTTAWSPTKMKFARPSNCPTMGIITGAENYGYAPFPNTDYDYERGLNWRKSEYNNSNTLVRQTKTLYQYLFKPGLTQPTSVTGLAYDRFANSTDAIYLYGRYSLLANVVKVASIDSVTTYDENNSSRFSTAVTQYNYNNGSNNRFITSVNQTTPDGTVYSNTFKYVSDYTLSSSSYYAGLSNPDAAVWMLAKLKDANRTNVVIEQTNTVKPLSGTITTTGAKLIKFNPFIFNKPLLRYQMAFRPSSPVTNFAVSGITSDSFVNDPGYDIVTTFNEYDNYDVPVSVTGEDNVTQGMLLGYSQRFPVATLSQATSSSVGFSDFETTSLASFTVTNGYYGTGRTGASAIHPFATLSRTIAKPTTALNYLLSFWAKPQSGATSISLSVTLKDANLNLISSTNYTFNYATGNPDFQYFTKSIAVSTLPSTFNIFIQGVSFSQPAGSSPSLLPVLDDIGFYPDYANISSSTYDIPFGSNSVTAPSGLTAFTAYDQMGRTKWLIDQDHNIRKRYTYSSAGQVIKPLTAALSSINGQYLINTAITFVADANSCFQGSGITYEWNFGSGYSSPSTSNLSPAHTYATIGNYSVNLRVTNPTTTPVTVVITVISFTIGNGSGPLSVIVTSPGVNGSGWATLTANPSDTNTGVTYLWSQRNVGATGWNNSGGTSNTFTQKIIPNTSIEFKCTVTSGDGRTASASLILSN